MRAVMVGRKEKTKMKILTTDAVVIPRSLTGKLSHPSLVGASADVNQNLNSLSFTLRAVIMQNIPDTMPTALQPDL